MVAVADPEPIDHEAILLGPGLLRVGRPRRDRPRSETGDRRDDLEHGTRHVAPERGTWQQRLVVILLERLERAVGGGRIGQCGRGVRRGRGHGQHLAVPRIQHHDRALAVAERADRGALQLQGQRQGQVLRVVRVGAELAQRVGHGIPGQSGQLRVVGELQAGPAIATRGVSDDLADGLAAIDAVQLPVRVLLVARQDLPVTIEDGAAWHGPGRRDDGRIERRADELGGLDDGPVTARRGQGPEGDREGQRDVDDRAPEGPSTGRRRKHQALLRWIRRRQPVAVLGGGGGSTPRSDSASSRPTTTALARSDDPP